MSRIYEIADQYVNNLTELDPVLATHVGVAGFDDRLTDYSPDGAAERADLARSTLAQLQQAPIENDADRIARDAMAERLSVGLQQFELLEHLRDLNVIASPFQSLRQVFDLMPRATLDDWRNIAHRFAAVPDALRRYQRALNAGIERALVASTRQSEGCAQQADVWSGRSEGTDSFFHQLSQEFGQRGLKDNALRRDLERAADAAAAAYADMAAYLRNDYLPRATTEDAVGWDRYSVAAWRFNGLQPDLEELYGWGWQELHRIEREMSKTAQNIRSGAGLAEVIRELSTDPDRAIEGEDAFRQWMQDLQEQTISELDGKHFDIPQPVKTIECLIAPPGGALAMYYTSPSEDFSRPGRVWYPTGGKTRFPIWGEVSVAYHEGVPGHHLQIATATYMRERLSRFQRLLGGTSGHAEGWALYAERLMAELGYLDNPEYYLGMLVSHAFRAARVIIDIGMHLQLKIPTSEPFHPGETWNADLGLEMLLPHCPFDRAFAESEIDRYLGWPGQAISYKLGERTWLEARDQARKSAGGGFDLKAWHRRALEIGPLGLDQLRRETSAISS